MDWSFGVSSYSSAGSVVDFLATTHLWELYEASLESAKSSRVQHRLMTCSRQSGVAVAGAIALLVVSPTIEAKIFPPAGVAYVAPPPGYHLNIRSGPGTHYPAINTLSRGTPITVTGHYEHGWAQLADRSWVAGNLINSRHPVSGGSSHHPGVPSLAYIAGDNNVNIRSGPGIEYPVVITLPPGAEIRITGFYEHGWAQLEDRSWVASNLIQVGAPTQSGPPPDATLRVGSRGPRVLQVEMRLKDLGYVTNDFVPDEYYGSDTEQAVRNFQSRNNDLPIDGLVDAQTAAQLTSPNAVPNPDRYVTLRVGDRSPAVGNLERRLQELGYLQFELADNVYDANTETAVIDFQSRNGLPVNGVATVQTQQVLYSAGAIPALSDPVYRELRLGDRDPAVRDLEIQLQNLNYLRGQIADNEYDANTETAVIDFQSRNGLPVNGVATVTTQEILYSADAIPASSAPVYKELRLGDRDPAVRDLEIQLQNLNYLPGQIPDNEYNRNTETAVINFQGRNGLPVNGVATVTTQEILYSANAVSNNNEGVEPPIIEPGDQQATVRTNDGGDAIAFTGPGIENDLAAFIPNGTIVTLTGKTENNWYELEDRNWIEGSFIVF